MKIKFFSIAAVAIFMVLPGFAQKVNPWLRGDDNKSTEQVRSYWLNGIAPQGVVSTLEHEEIVGAIKQSFSNAGFKGDWRAVVARSRCVDPPMDLKKRTIRFWGSLGGKAQLMEQPRELRRDEKIFVDPETNFILGGCQCANLLDVPMEWSTPLCLPEDLDGYSTADDPVPTSTEIDTRPQPAPVPRTNQQSSQNDQGSSSSSHSSSTSRSSSDCYGDDCDQLRRRVVDRHYEEVGQYLSMRDRDLANMNDEYLRVKQGESNIRNQDKAMDALVEKSRCCDEYSHYDGGSTSREVVYVQDGMGGGGVSNSNTNINVIPTIGGGNMVHPVMNGYRPWQRHMYPVYPRVAPFGGTYSGGGQQLRPTRGPNNR